MTLESQIQQFIKNAKPGDAMLLSKDGDAELGTGLILQRSKDWISLLDDFTHFGEWDHPDISEADLVLKEALLWSYRTGQELATPDAVPTIGYQLMQRCYRHGMAEDKAMPLIRDLLGDLANWLDQRHGGSSQTAELLRAIHPENCP